MPMHKALPAICPTSTSGWRSPSRNILTIDRPFRIGATPPRARFFCRLSALSLVRLLAHPRLMSDKPFTLAKAWSVYRRFAALPGVAMLAEPDGLDEALGAFVTPRLAARLFTDAYLAALARSSGLRLVTFDRDFERFDRLAMLRLEASAH